MVTAGPNFFNLTVDNEFKQKKSNWVFFAKANLLKLFVQDSFLLW